MMYIDRKNPPPTFGEVKKEWKEEGREEGIEEGKKQVALRMLKDGMSVEVVASYALIPIDVVKKLYESECSEKD